tara:strand:+ start:1351 stop:1959 length:609 start_codon:yes stop_codon:yes gene_type:complete
MFTGIVQGIGTVTKVSKQESVTSVTISLSDVKSLQIGASVSINGVCLTVVSLDGNNVSFDIINETITRTNLGDLSSGEAVNFERSLKFGDEVGGHILSGHIMDTGLIHSKSVSGEQMSISILAPPSVEKFIIEKGYIAIDGISLTVGEVKKGIFSLHIIPETLRLTMLGSKEIGDVVNLEVDSNTQIIVETVERLMKERGVV